MDDERVPVLIVVVSLLIFLWLMQTGRSAYIVKLLNTPSANFNGSGSGINGPIFALPSNSNSSGTPGGLAQVASSGSDSNAQLGSTAGAIAGSFVPGIGTGIGGVIGGLIGSIFG